MEENIICPSCKTNFKTQPEICTNCGFPFSGTEHEKSIFIGQQILKKGKVKETKDRVKRARIILWIIGGFNMTSPFLIYRNYPSNGIYITIGIVIGLVFIGLGLLTYKKPFISILISIILLMFYYLIDALYGPSTLFQGLVWKIAIISSLIYGLISIIQAEKIKKESLFLKKQKYK